MHKKIVKIFCEHPASVGETYWQHFRFAFHISLESFKISFIAFAHALFPFLFLAEASNRLESLQKTIQHRRAHEEKSFNCDCS
jgi:Family of unknown function (DUF6356)